jgi:hypothetical protein
MYKQTHIFTNTYTDSNIFRNTIVKLKAYVQGKVQVLHAEQPFQKYENIHHYISSQAIRVS